MLWANNRIRFVLTAECNINCFYCHNEGQPKSNHFFSEALFDHVLELIKNENEKIDSVTFTGGEPLLHPLIDKFISQISSHTQKITLISNGILVNKQRLLTLKTVGVSKIRLGVDSLLNKKFRPTDGIAIFNTNIYQVISDVLDSGIRLEINVVITKYNRKEIPSLIEFCQSNSISAKFFELIEVNQFGDELTDADISLSDGIPFSEFKISAKSIIKNCKYYPDGEIPDDFVFEGQNFTIRYCRYLCLSGSCYKTGTRIDPDGAVYTCMGQRGKFKINDFDTIDKSRLSIKEAVDAGCKEW